MSRVAVLGAGFQGTCAALALARRGVEVDLYDLNDACITQAGLRNEGKIHLGFVYANDASFGTARLLAQGALCFAAALRRWLECDIAAIGVSTPHTYAVHRDSILSAEAVLAHFTRVRDCVRELADAAPCRYLDQDARTIAFDTRDCGAIFDPETVAAVIHTDERSVDVVRLAALLRARVAAEPRVTFHPGARVTAAARHNGSIAVSFMRQGAVETARHENVVNCLWDGKIAIDRQMQFLPPYRSLYRLKFGVNIGLKRTELELPSATFVARHGLRSGSQRARIRRRDAGGDCAPEPRKFHGTDLERVLMFIAGHFDGTAWRGVFRRRALAVAEFMRGNAMDNFAADVAWLGRLAQAGEFRRIPLPLYRKRIRAESVAYRWGLWDEATKATACRVHGCELLRDALKLKFSNDEQGLIVDAVLRRALAIRPVHPFGTMRDLPRSRKLATVRAVLAELRLAPAAASEIVEQDPGALLERLLNELPARE